MGGGSQQPFQHFSLDFLSKVEGSCDHFTDPLCRSKVLEHQEKRRKQTSSFAGYLTRRPRRSSSRPVLFIRRRTRTVERGRHNVTRAGNQLVERKVRILKKLIPNCSSESAAGTSVGLDNLFRETADYILALQLRVKLMQIMVDALSGSAD